MTVNISLFTAHHEYDPQLDTFKKYFCPIHVGSSNSKVSLDIKKDNTYGKLSKFNSDNKIEFNSIFYDYVNKNEKQLKFIDPLKWSCKLKCTTLLNGQSIYHDSNHLNRKGSLFFKEQFASELNILLEK